ncbi:UNVERIFIED_CONTAM: hypothetical protein C3P01_01475 [Clostridioides difficile]|uniref:hypothetical protein n=1 Tax=Clostridioides difficile TaxID=1496 RepID=UPI00038CDB6E|nr:hypothetical protein [Clostridioides difficile]EQE83407.1 hypothetical protein QCW_3267 [Clostridioides difficile CD69]OYO89367.1 hypothetical protein B7359_07190 [Clostridioides difficile]HBE9726376.1 hypothetical protein [Clostridioides difficile]HBF7936530.1 hypothetical protein [Clostridioides difficile]HBG6489835.1 hypothetical protein [Clostridioides difficile]
MINLWKKEDVNLLSEYPKEVVESVDNIIDILDENYGHNRRLTDDGGYVCIIEDIKDVEDLKSNILKGIVEEFSDVIYEDEVNMYNSTLYILSSDYSVTVISKNEETEYLLK